MKLIPQEVELWYVYPSLRKEMANLMVKGHGLKQKEVAEKLGVTKAAISHYVNEKRSKKKIFDKNFEIKIEKSVKKIIEDDVDSAKEIQYLLSSIRKNKTLCDIHRMFDDNVPKKCDICYEK
tara:strand:- start:340 stop:705 length:366 start_codon:yes stop_codon:yes gene_type:complete